MTIRLGDNCFNVVSIFADVLYLKFKFTFYLLLHKIYVFLGFFRAFVSFLVFIFPIIIVKLYIPVVFSTVFFSTDGQVVAFKNLVQHNEQT